MTAISETELPHHQHQQENAQRETLALGKEEKQKEMQEKGQVPMDPELRQIQVRRTDPDPEYDHVRHVGISQASPLPAPTRYQHLPTTNLDPEMQHTMLTPKQQPSRQPEHISQQDEAAQNGEYGNSEEQANRVPQQEQSNEETQQLQEQPDDDEVKQEQSNEEIQEQPEDEIKQKSREEIIREQTPESVQVYEEKGVHSCQDNDELDEDDDKSAEDTGILGHSEDSTETEPTEEEDKQKMPQEASHAQPLEQEDKKADPGTATPITKHPTADESYEHAPKNKTDSSKDADSSDMTASSQEDRSPEGNKDQQASFVSNSSEEARGHIQGAIERAPVTPSPIQPELKTSEPDTSKEQSQSTKSETSFLAPVAAGTVTVQINEEDEAPSVGHLVVLTPKGKDTDIAKKLREDDDRASHGQSDDGTSLVDQYTINAASSRQSLNSAEITAIDEVSMEEETPLETTTIDDIEDNSKQHNETSRQTEDSERTQTENTVEKKADSSGH